MRIGGAEAPLDAEKKADIAIQINSDHVIIDNIWSWRADHDFEGDVCCSKNPSKNGLVVKGDNVTAYGAAVEHFLADQVIWEGDFGSMYFFQCELPYDVTQENFGDKGFTGLRVAEGVGAFNGWGLGVYHFFDTVRRFAFEMMNFVFEMMNCAFKMMIVNANVQEAVNVSSAIIVPDFVVPQITAALSIFLNGLGTINSIVNDFGNPTTPAGEPGAHTAYFCYGTPPPPPPPPPPGPPAPPTPPGPPGPPPPACMPGQNCPGGKCVFNIQMKILL